MNVDSRKTDMVQAPPLFYRGKVCYSGFATVAVSENQVNVVLEKVRRLVGPLASMSYALRMSMDDNSDIVEFSDDDGVFGAGELLMSALLRANLESAVVVVTVDGRGCFSPDFVPVEGTRLIGGAANAAADTLVSRIAAAEAEARALAESTLKERELSETLPPPEPTGPKFMRLVNDDTGEVTLVPMPTFHKRKTQNDFETFKPAKPVFADPDEVPMYLEEEMAEQAELKRLRQLKVAMAPFK